MNLLCKNVFPTIENAKCPAIYAIDLAKNTRAEKSQAKPQLNVTIADLSLKTKTATTIISKIKQI